ncbi:MAG: M23 family metallopeptidase [Erythrobacter sp.]|nr:M23 family metallopeptidase [Erythrobacter sp.]
MLVKIASIIAMGTLVLATPAMADETPTGAIDTSNVASVPGVNDAEFSELFANWEDLEQDGARVTASGTIAPAPRLGVSVPSRMPVEGVTLTSSYGMRNHPVLGGRRQHNGVDLAAPTGTPVYATADGLVQRAEWFSSYGNYIQIAHGNDIETRYAHLSGYAVHAGQEVHRGDLIGYVGTTGRSTGPHLHYEVRVADQPVNPLPYMVASMETSDDASLGRGGPE